MRHTALCIFVPAVITFLVGGAVDVVQPSPVGPGGLSALPRGPSGGNRGFPGGQKIRRSKFVLLFDYRGLYQSLSGSPLRSKGLNLGDFARRIEIQEIISG